jgi:Xaa-Pro aminopeptidase
MQSTATTASISGEEYERRIANLRSQLAADDIDAVVIWARGGGTVERFANVQYLCGHYPFFPIIRDVPGAWADRGYAALVVTQDSAVLCSDDRFSEPRAVTDHLALNVGNGETLGDLIANVLAGKRRRIAVCGTDTMTARQFGHLEKAVAPVCDAELVIVDDLVERLRSIKSPAEIALLEQAGRIADASFRAALDVLRAGAREADVVAALVAEATRSDAVVANAFVATFGEDADGLPDGAPTWSQRVLRPGDLFTVDFSGAYRGYFFDLARSRVIDHAPTDAQASAFALAKDSVNAAVAAAVPGATVSDVAKAADDLLRAQDYDFAAAEFQAGGHGLGLGFEAPWIRAGDPRPIEVGMTLALERFVIREGTGATFERNIVVTEDGPRDLHPVIDIWSEN